MHNGTHCLLLLHAMQLLVAKATSSESTSSEHVSNLLSCVCIYIYVYIDTHTYLYKALSLTHTHAYIHTYIHTLEQNLERENIGQNDLMLYFYCMKLFHMI